ncbi:MAG: indole-3-glycerol-phosphate synthase, partial [Proteobacteria bacterium]|nr:indole-3-glycerol-phosphate synthase [Pseudomonadota bacterium]
MSGGFLQTAAFSARENVKKWAASYDPLTRRPAGGRAEFLAEKGSGCGIIAEVKIKSPSRGDLLKEKDPLALARIYSASGAEAISVVVEEKHFGGSPALFERVRECTSLPLLWKDFVVDPYQIRLAASLGASAILLVWGLVSPEGMRVLIHRCRREGLKPLVEVHNERDLKEALEAGADLIGVNNRNLVSLEVDTGVSERLAPMFPPGVAAISESGVRGAADVGRMAGLGYRAVLVGEALVTAEDPAALLGEMA